MQAEGYAEGMERAEEPQYSALPRHVRHGKAQAALQNHQSHMSLIDPVSSSELEGGEEDRKAAEGDSTQATLHSMHIREHALRHAHEIGLHRAISQVKTEREKYLRIMKMGRN